MLSVCSSRKEALIFLQAIFRSFYKYVIILSCLLILLSQNDLTFQYSVGGRGVCTTAFQNYWAITEYTRRKIQKSIVLGQSLDVPHGNSFYDHPDPKSAMCHDWLATFCDVGEKQPDSEQVK
jgi:hypothetical protein